MGGDAPGVRGFPLAYARTQRFTLGVPRSISVVDDGSLVVFLRAPDGTTPALSLWTLDVETGRERQVVDPADLGVDDTDLPPAERARRERVRESAAGIVQYSLARHRPLATFVLAGSIYVTELRSGDIRRIATATPAFDAQLSPDGSVIAYVHGADLRVATLGDTEHSDDDRRLSPAGGDTVTWGQAEFVAAEEMGRRRGHWWAPDSSGLVATRVDVAPVTRWYIGDPADPSAPPVEVRYPAAGTTNAEVTLHHLPLEGPTRELPWSAGHEYLADVIWTDPDPVIVRQMRDQRATSIVSISIATRSTTELRTITDPRWTELHPGSPRLGNGRLYTIEDLTDRRALCVDGLPLTGPDITVRGIVDDDAAGVVVTASVEDPTQVHVLRVTKEGVEQLTTVAGVHGAVASGSTMVVTSARPDSPFTTIDICCDGHRTASLTNAAEDPVLRADPDFRFLGRRGLATALFLPSDHDGSPLPVLLDPYGGPHAQRVLRNHTPHLVSRWFAEHGFAVVVTDGRGTPGRGPAFEREIWGDLATPVLEDQLDALDAAAAEVGALDLDRVGIRGWSFGGYLAALAVLRAPDRIHAAVAGAPVIEWSLYDTHYTERYLGDPDDHPHHYERSSLLSDAAKLERPLLLIHGLADDNVVAAHSLRFSSALLAHGRPHQLLPLSGVTHMTSQDVVAQNLLLLQLDFLTTHLSHGNRR